MNNYIRRVETLRLAGSPQLFTLKQLALSTDVDWSFLRGVVQRSGRVYRSIRIPKKTGGYRDLQSPTDQLMGVQRWILHNLLTKVSRHPNNFAYFEGVTTRQCSERHAGSRWMIKTDLHNYFPSVSEQDVYFVFRRLGYSALLSFELARICTWPRPTAADPGSPAENTTSLPYAAGAQGALPQGAPTSGALANAATLHLDESLSAFSSRERLVYTRYSDDMSFSSSEEFNRPRAAQLITQIRKIVTASGLALHQRKTKVIPPGARKVVLGMQVTSTGVAILPEQRRRVDLYIHCVQKFGPVSFAEVRKFDSPLTLINHVEGWLAYLWHIDPDWTQSRSELWSQALANHQVFSRALA